MKVYAFRLRRGQDLLKELFRFAWEHDLRGAVILSCVGCLSHWRLRDAGGVQACEKTEPVEIVSATGTISRERLHLHISLSREDLSTIGGHLLEGCIVNTTAEIVLLELESCSFSSLFHPETGYDELIIHDV